MLSLDSPRWAELLQAYGTAEDVPRLIAALWDLADERERAELWFALWGLLCQDERVHTAAYAAAPHLVELLLRDGGERFPLRERAQGAQLVACIEAYRHHDGAPPIPADLVADYAAAVERLPALVWASVHEPWDADVARVMAGALLVAKRQPRLGIAVMRLESSGEELG
jgi:hypothetical protein